MRRTAMLIAATLLAWLWAEPARASGDYGCEPSWQLEQRRGCDDMAMLGPGNDTRMNLLLLLVDADRLKPTGQPFPTDPMGDWTDLLRLYAPRREVAVDMSYALGEGSRCRSNASGAAAFEAALGAARGLPAEERAALVAARRGWTPACAGAGAGRAAMTEVAGRVRSRAGKAFARYLLGAAAFYDGAYDKAASAFTTLRGADDPWLKDTAAYMRARVEVNRLQVGLFTEWGSFAESAHADPVMADRAETGLRA